MSTQIEPNRKFVAQDEKSFFVCFVFVMFCFDLMVSFRFAFLNWFCFDLVWFGFGFVSFWFRFAKYSSKPLLVRIQGDSK